jgi:ATP-dependent exoDNAse (exonuclease V) alpha subunit
VIQPLKLKLPLGANPPSAIPRIISPIFPPSKRIIAAEVAAIDAAIEREDTVANGRTATAAMVLDRTESSPKLSRLISEDFTFDESQLHAIHTLSHYQFACMTGAAGTGKTTCLKKVVDEIQDQLPVIDMSKYWKNGVEDDPDDPVEIPEKLIPGVALVAYTGRASQMIKKNFPRDWHGNIMTIHRLLGFYPVWNEAPDPETGMLKKKVQFVPTYNADFKMPWKVILIDEAGMLGLDLWHQLLAACTDDCRIIFVGDINQLTPTHGKSIFGFAMAKYPSVELTHIHRQKGKNNSIVDAAWAVINGQYPKSDDMTSPDWKFILMELSAEPRTASKQLRKWLDKIRGPVYDPLRDTVITPINAFKETSGWELGQDPLNRELAIMFNKEHGRFIIDAGRDRKYFAVGDKVMATKNDHMIGITNGMTGIITSIEANGGYQGNSARFGLIDEVNEYLRTGVIDEEEPENEISLEDIANFVLEEESEDKTEKAERGPSSHIITVQFGTAESPLEVSFGTLAEVESLMMAYVVTCHKMQGGEAPFIVVICHQAHKRMLTREWLYTAITRASERCVILYTRMGLSSAVNKQVIKGRNLKEKVEAFNKMIDPKGLLGASVHVRLPDLPKDQVDDGFDSSHSNASHSNAIPVPVSTPLKQNFNLNLGRK